MDVLQQRVPEQIVVGGLPDDRRDRCQAGLLGGPPAALPHHELVVRAARTRGDLSHHDRLHQAEFTDRMHKLGKRLLVEHLTWLARVGDDVRRVDLPVIVPPGDHDLARRATDHDICGRLTQPRTAVGRAGRNQRRQSAAEAPLAA